MKANVMQRRAGDAKKRLVEKVIDALPAERLAGQPIDAADFIRQYYNGVSAEDLRERGAKAMAGAAVAHLHLAQTRKPGALALRVFNADRSEDGFVAPHTYAQLVNDDMPFLVDTLGIVVNELGLSMHITVHPILRVLRDDAGRLQRLLADDEAHADSITESFIKFEIDKVTDATLLAKLETSIRKSMRDVRAATGDWTKMRDLATRICIDLEQNPPPLDPLSVSESRSLVEWMAQDHFTFLGFRDYRLERREGKSVLASVDGTGLGILRDAPSSVTAQPDTGLQRAIREQALSKDLLIITKANSRSTVHRSGYLDYVSVKTFGTDGRPSGERRFLGLFTSVAYSRSPRDIPLLRHKVNQVMARSGLAPNSHGGKALLHILETYPRDELFQSSVEDLGRIAEGILGLQERQRVKLFVRRDAFRRFFSCLVYVPREKYNTQIRQRIEKILMAGLNGDSVESRVQISESTLARVQIMVRTLPGVSSRISVKAVEQELTEAVRGWDDVLRETLTKRYGEERGLGYFYRYQGSFPAAYVEDTSPRAAAFDVQRIDDLGGSPTSLQLSLYRPPSYAEKMLRLKLFRPQEQISLSVALPMLENMGLRVIGERPYHLKVDDAREVWLHDFEMQYDGAEVLDPERVNAKFRGAFVNIWGGRAENDEFNRLVLCANLDWREAALLRAYCRYLLQTGLPYSQAYMEEVVNANPRTAELLLQVFHARFTPELPANERAENCAEAETALLDAIAAVASADEDRILRAFQSIVTATLRTNFYQVDAQNLPKPYISFKLDPNGVPDLPKPRPMYEVFVYSPRMEGVHLRGGDVARGGLRWSDRREDFRTEVLGLMKAQKVKNTIIVPTGAKGGFVCKRLPQGDRDAVMHEVQACYRNFVRGLLDLTDNIVAGALAPPPQVVRRDHDDPYLVVAADKGTATFSDLANEVAASYDFWLGDAFASGGSAGYDHKKMGITAKGAWEAVKRHFLEIGVDVQQQDFTACGIGDMSGDVFGNGMLRSEHTKLIAAFNHMHIFLDPDPDPARSFAERQRLFELPRSTWKEYAAALISTGGGVYSRHDKKIPISPQVRALLALDEGVTELPPDELIRAILRMPVDLLWNGGIGTYIKASHESHADAGDRANDPVRVDARDLRCKVIGEGGNLGVTQLGRVEYALHDGRMNTDFIDNSGGVDCSDREVNIKILLNQVERDGTLTREERNDLLETMTSEVEMLVLRDNYAQTQTISLMEMDTLSRVKEYNYLVRRLERAGELDPALEFLPAEPDILERHKAGRGYTRPELAVILSYSKISLYGQLVESDIADDPYLSGELANYFPQPLRERYPEALDNHRLRREIIATQVTNSLINRMGPTFIHRTMDGTGATPDTIARAYSVARESFDMRKLWTAIESLDSTVHANAKYSMMNQSARLLRRATIWFLNEAPAQWNIAALVAKFQPGIGVIAKRLPKLLSDTEIDGFDEASQIYADHGVPRSITKLLAGMTHLYSALDIVAVAHNAEVDESRVAGIYFRLGAGLKLGWLHDQIENLHVDGRWQAMARDSLRENLYLMQRELTAQIIQHYPQPKPEDAVTSWLIDHKHQIARLQGTLDDMRGGATMDFATLSVASQEIRRLSLGAAQ